MNPNLRFFIRLIGLGVVLCFIILSLTGCQGLSPVLHPDKDETVEKFPQSIYPPADKFPDQLGFQGTTGCPNLQDVEVPDPKSTEELFSIISEFGKTREGDLELSDCAFWPIVEGDWEWRKQHESQENQPLTQRVSIEQIVSMSATESPYADLISNNCGSKTLELSWCVAVLPPGAGKIEDAPSLTSYYYLIKRSGNWLIWSNPH
ncbi:hypothetical protein ES703_88835 [subsurface metagenome]